MKKIYETLLVFACLISLTLHAQVPHRKAIASPAQLNTRLAPRTISFSETPTRAIPAEPKDIPTTGKVTAVNPIQLGTSTNVFSIVKCEGNQVLAVDSLDLVCFIHRNDVNTYGGTSGQLRYDVSIGGGSVFVNDVGVLNPGQTRAARYPMVAGYHPAPGGNPLDAKLVYGAATLASSGSTWDGYVVGVSSINTTGAISTTENYFAQGNMTTIPSGLAQSAPGIYWIADFIGNGTVPQGDLIISKGVWDNGLQDVVWSVVDTVAVNHNTAVNGSANIVGPNIAFAPSGQIGWIAFLGDIVGGPDSTLQPIFIKTTDCGNTWGAPIEVDLNSVPWVADSLQTLWVDSLGNPASNGNASCSFDFDLTVDGAGAPHLGTVICTGQDYSVLSGLAKFLGDVTSNSGGATWDIDYISPVLAFRTPDFGTTTTVNMDNFVQVSRDEGGCTVFYSWVDSDTSQFTGNQNGIGFGESTNMAPNLRVAARNVVTGQQQYPRLISDMDIIWEGTVFFPTMAPVVMSDAAGWELPIVGATMQGMDPINQATFWYWGNDVQVPNGSWCSPGTMNLSWDHFGYSSFVSNCSGIPVAFCNTPPSNPCVITGVKDGLTAGLILHEAYPNPTNGHTRIGFTLPVALDIELTVYNALGQPVAQLAHGTFEAGKHELELDATKLAAGVYHYSLRAGEYRVGKALMVTK